MRRLWGGTGGKAASPDLPSLARASGDPFRESAYYELAEPHIDEQWDRVIWPRISRLDFSVVVDLAAGHGRNSAKLATVAGRLIIVDINRECLDACRRRLGDDDRFEYVLTGGYSLEGVGDASVTLVYSFDSMVHFAPEVVEAYLGEIARTLTSGGHAFLHHSNYSDNPDGDFREAPHWRNHMSVELMADLAEGVGLEVVTTELLDWGAGEDAHAALDALTLLEKP